MRKKRSRTNHNKDNSSSGKGSRQLRGEQQLAEDTMHQRREIPPLYPQNDRQTEAMHCFVNNQVIFLTGSAGTGKTELAVYEASKQWINGQVDNIIIARPNKTLGKDGGAVKGGDTEKLLEFVRPMLEKFRKYLGVHILKNNLRMDSLEGLFAEKRGIQVVPVEKIQGRSFDDRTIVLIDEAQNCEVSQMISCCTRTEEGCTQIIMGDPTQSAIGARNGLSFMLHLLERKPTDLAGVVKFLPEDNLRSGFSAHITQVVGEEYESWIKAK